MGVRTLNVIENTGRKNVCFPACHDVYDNTDTYMRLATMFMKINGMSEMDPPDGMRFHNRKAVKSVKR